MLRSRCRCSRARRSSVKGDREVEYKTIRGIVFEISKTHLMGVSLAASQIKEGK